MMGEMIYVNDPLWEGGKRVGRRGIIVSFRSWGEAGSVWLHPWLVKGWC